MKNTVLIAIIVIAIVIGVGTAVFLSGVENQNTEENKTAETYKELVEEYKNSSNPASKIGDSEVLITSDNFENEITNYEGTVLVDVFLPTCSHCQAMGPIVSEIAEEYSDYKVGKIDASKESTLATKFEISSVPAFILFKNGEEVDRKVGEMPKEDLIKFMTQ